MMTGISISSVRFHRASYDVRVFLLALMFFTALEWKSFCVFIGVSPFFLSFAMHLILWSFVLLFDVAMYDYVIWIRS